MSCTEEAAALIQCTNGASPDGCAAAFIAMRECNRGMGELTVEKSGSISVSSSAKSLYNVGGAAAPPVRSIEGMKTAGEELAKKLQIDGTASIRF